MKEKEKNTQNITDGKKEETIIVDDKKDNQEIIIKESEVKKDNAELVASEVKNENASLAASNEKKEVLPPAKPQKRLVDKFSLAIFIIAIITMVVGFIPMFAVILVMLYEFVLIIIALLTLFLLLLNEDFKNLLAGGNQVFAFAKQLLTYSPYVLGGAGGLFLISLVLFCFSKSKKRRILGIIFSALFLAISIVGLVFSLNVK